MTNNEFIKVEDGVCSLVIVIILIVYKHQPEILIAGGYSYNIDFRNYILFCNDECQVSFIQTCVWYGTKLPLISKLMFAYREKKSWD